MIETVDAAVAAARKDILLDALRAADWAEGDEGGRYGMADPERGGAARLYIKMVASDDKKIRVPAYLLEASTPDVSMLKMRTTSARLVFDNLVALGLIAKPAPLLVADVAE